MAEKSKLIGKVFGLLTVIAEAENKIFGKSKISVTQWLCKCVCKEELLITTSQLTSRKNGRTSCGCQHFTGEHKGRKYEDPKLISYTSLVKRYRGSARNKRRSLEWQLTLGQAKILFDGNCFYCGAPPKNTYNVYKTKAGRYITRNKNWADKAEILFNGIDRLDTNLHYSVDNCVSCCTTCNFAKNQLSLEDFYEWIQRIALYQGFKK